MKNIILNIKLKLIKLLINSIWKYNSNMCKDKFTESTLADLYTLINTDQIQRGEDNINIIK